MTTNSPNPVDGDVQALIERIGVALKQFTNGRASMHVPPLDTDVDIVLVDCEKMLKSLTTPPAQLLRLVDLSKCKKIWHESDYSPVDIVCIPVEEIEKALRQQGYEVKS